MSGPFLRPGNVVAVPASVAAALVQLPGFPALRVASRGSSAYPVLAELYRLGMENSVPSAGTGDLSRRAGVPEWITTAQAAELLGIGERAVTKRLVSGQLDGSKHGGRWRVDRKGIELANLGRVA